MQVIEQSEPGLFLFEGNRKAPVQISFFSPRGYSGLAEWDFDNGHTSDLLNPSDILFAFPGIYKVSLRLKTGNLERNVLITGHSYPVAYFSFTLEQGTDEDYWIIKLFNDSVNADKFIWKYPGASPEGCLPARLTLKKNCSIEISLLAIKGELVSAPYSISIQG